MQILCQYKQLRHENTDTLSSFALLPCINSNVTPRDEGLRSFGYDPTVTGNARGVASLFLVRLGGAVEIPSGSERTTDTHLGVGVRWLTADHQQHDSHSHGTGSVGGTRTTEW